MLQPCTVVPTIAQDATFRIQTALLWLRFGTAGPDGVVLRDISTDATVSNPSIRLSDVMDGKPSDDTVISIQTNISDLGLLHFHRDRLAAAAEAFGWHDLSCLEHSEKAVHNLRSKIEEHIQDRPPLPESTTEAYKVRILVDRIGKITVESSLLGVYASQADSVLPSASFMPTSFDEPWHPDDPPCKVYLDQQPTRPSTLTSHKTTHRCVYTTARQRSKISPTTSPMEQEVLLYNPYGEITETSCCTVYIKKNGEWITPAAICGPTIGVSRRLAIEKGLCKQGTIELRELRPNEEIWLSNAVRGFFKGILIMDAQLLSDNAANEEVVQATTDAELNGPVQSTQAMATI